MNSNSQKSNFKLLIRILLIINILILASTWIFTAISYFDLPEIIPVHFGFDGVPDRFGERKTNFALPVISTVNFIFLTYIGQNPDSPLLNVPDSLRQNKSLTQVFVQAMLTFVLLLFLSIVYETVQVAKGNQETISYITDTILAGMFLFILLFFIFARRYSKKQIEKTD